MTPLARAVKFRGTSHKSEEPTPARRHAAGFFGNGVGDATVPITRTSSSRSVTAVVSLALHLLLAAVVPSLDGSIEAAVHDRQVHVEAPGDGPCAPLHDHLTCQLCRIAERGALASAPVAVVLETAPAGTFPILAEQSAAPVVADRSSLQPRAPPIA